MSQTCTVIQATCRTLAGTAAVAPDGPHVQRFASRAVAGLIAHSWRPLRIAPYHGEPPCQLQRTAAVALVPVAPGGRRDGAVDPRGAGPVPLDAPRGSTNGYDVLLCRRSCRSRDAHLRVWRSRSPTHHPTSRRRGWTRSARTRRRGRKTRPRRAANASIEEISRAPG
jgi:hypothetical protein